MNVLVDTSVWSLALRRKNERRPPEAIRLEQLILQGESIFLIGVILQEILQGIRSKEDFQRLSKILSSFPLIPLKRDDYILAATIGNKCREKGVQASTMDFLIAATAVSYDCYLFTSDKDFLNISKHITLKLL